MTPVLFDNSSGGSGGTRTLKGISPHRFSRPAPYQLGYASNVDNYILLYWNNQVVFMKDIQSENDLRKISLDKVGIKGIRYPIIVKDKENKFQNTTGVFSIYVFLPHNFRGTHMSRFVEVLNRHSNNLSQKNLNNILDDVKKTLNSKEAHLQVDFPYFLSKNAPISKIESISSYDCSFIANKNDKMDFTLNVQVPVTTLCPCSKEISKYGAHNQRALVSVFLHMNKMVWIEDIINYVEKSGSAPIYSLLKRSDEKYITEFAYDNPKFVEDVTRDVAILLNDDSRVSWYKIEVESYESIHNHSAFSSLEVRKR